jgi:hypothetical protein
MNTRTLRIVAWLEISASLVLLGIAVWFFAGFCSGRFMGLDCESRAIFGVNMFGPIGVLALICSVWSLKTKSVVSQLILAFSVFSIMIYWLSHAF